MSPLVCLFVLIPVCTKSWAYSSTAVSETVVLSVNLPEYAVTTVGDNIQSMGGGQNLTVTNSTSGVVTISVQKGFYCQWVSYPASVIPPGEYNGYSSNAFYNGGCLAYNVTSNSTSKQLYVGVDEIYAAPNPVALPGSLCTDSCQKVVALDPKGAYEIFVQDNSTTGSHLVNVSFGFYQPHDPVCSSAQAPYQAVAVKQQAPFPNMAIGAIQNTHGMYGANSIDFLAVLTNVSCLSWGVAVVGEGNTIESSDDVFLTLLEQSDFFNALRDNTLASVSESPSAILCRGDPTAFSPCALGSGQFPTVPSLKSTSTYYLLLTNLLNTEQKLAIVYSPRNAASCLSGTFSPSPNAYTVHSSPLSQPNPDPACGASSIVENANDIETENTISSLCG